MMKSKQERGSQILITLSNKQKATAQKLADKEDIKLATFLRTCITKYLRKQGVDF